MTIYNLENLAGVHSSMHIHILCTTEIQLLETQVTVCCCIPLLTVLTKRSLFSSFSYCLQCNILESHTSHFCWHILQYVFLVIKIVQKTSVLYYSVFCCIFTVNVIALLNCKKKIGKLLPSIVCHIRMNCRALLLRFVKNIINIFFFPFHIILLYLPQHELSTYQPVSRPIELYFEWLFNQGPQSKYEYSAFCQGHSKLPIHTAPCLPQFPQQPITIALESRETIATLGPWMLLAGSIE